MHTSTINNHGYAYFQEIIHTTQAQGLVLVILQCMQQMKPGLTIFKLTKKKNKKEKTLTENPCVKAKKQQ